MYYFYGIPEVGAWEDGFLAYCFLVLPVVNPLSRLPVANIVIKLPLWILARV